MLSQPKNRVQAIKSKFENLTSESTPLKQPSQLFRLKNEYERKQNKENANSAVEYNNNSGASEAECSGSSDDCAPSPNRSYLYKSDVKRSVSEPKPTLSRQSSDPGKKLHRSHAFRCEKTQKLSPKRHGSCNSRPEIKMDRKLSKDRLKRLGDILDEQMKKENFIVGEAKEVGLNFKTVGVVKEIVPNLETNGVAKEVGLHLDTIEVVKDAGLNSVPNENVPPHILAQYAQVIKPKKKDENDVMTDSGVSSETENLDEDKGRVKKITDSFEKTENNLDVMEDLAGSSETMKLERKNPHLILTDTLKKALKQPLPRGPPPKKPPRSFIPTILENEKKDTKRKLEKLEQLLMKRESRKDNNIYDIAEENLSLKRPKEVHYLCTEILDITQRTLLPNQEESPLKNCFNKLNCAMTYNSMSSLPYTRLSSGFNNIECGCSNENLNNMLLNGKCMKCQNNEEKHGFKCHLDCKCRVQNSEFYVDEHIYDEPCVSDEGKYKGKSKYGTLNKVNGAFSKSLEELRVKDKNVEAVIYEVPCDRSSTPDVGSGLRVPKTDFQKLLQNFENGAVEKTKDRSTSPSKLSLKTLEDLKFTLRPEQLSPKTLEVPNRSPKDNSPKAPELVVSEVKYAKKAERKYGTEVKRYRPGVSIGYSQPKKNPQLDVDRENLNALMNEIYETVTAACNMEENKPGSFPTDQSDSSTSEESVKLTRSLTEKRKNYVRRVSSRLAYLEPKNIKTTRFRHQTSICSYKSDIVANPYSTFRSWKSFRASQNNLPKMESDSKYNLTDSTGNILSMKHDFDSDGSIDNISIDEKAGCVDIELPFEPRENGLFNVCLLVGLNYMTAQAYVKSVFPSQVQVPQHIENLIFPETLGQDKTDKGEWSATARDTQCYSFILTDERGERSYGYCRRVLPEGATACLPLCYCLIGRYRAPGLYYKVLQEIESHHGGSETEMLSILQQLFESDFPNPGEGITLTIETDVDDDKCTDKCKFPDAKCTEKCKSDADKCKSDSKCTEKRKSDDNCNGTDSPDSDSDRDKCTEMCKSDVKRTDKCKTMPDMRMSEKYYDPENNNSLRELMLTLNGIRSKTITRPLEPRAEESSSCALLDCLGAGLLVKVFGSLLLERKLIVRADQLSSLSSLLEALQSSLYPFVWQQPLISCVPAEIQRAVIDAPLPILAGTLHKLDCDGDTLEEGMFIDLSHPSKVLCYQGDESTILPTNSYKTLKTSLQMESIKNKDRDDTKTRNVMISEAFLRFFVDILGEFWRHFHRGVLRDGDMGKGGVVFDKDAFIKSATSKQNQYFLEWFTETAMFNHFIQNMAVRSECNDSENTTLVDTPTPNYYQLFEERIHSRRNRTNVDRSGYKNALHKRVKLLKARLKDLVG